MSTKNQIYSWDVKSLHKINFIKRMFCIIYDSFVHWYLQMWEILHRTPFIHNIWIYIIDQNVFHNTFEGLFLSFSTALPNLKVMRVLLVNRPVFVYQMAFGTSSIFVSTLFSTTVFLNNLRKWISLQSSNFVLISQSIMSGEIILPSSNCCGHEHCMASPFFWCWHVYDRYKT